MKRAETIKRNEEVIEELVSSAQVLRDANIKRNNDKMHSLGLPTEEELIKEIEERKKREREIKKQENEINKKIKAEKKEQQLLRKFYYF